MGVNLVPVIENFRILPNRIFSKNNPEDEHDLEICIKEGVKYRLLKFDYICYNKGDEDFIAGSPKSRPDIFILSPAHSHYHIKDFNRYRLIDNSGQNAIPSLKEFFLYERYDLSSSKCNPQIYKM